MSESLASRPLRTLGILGGMGPLATAFFMTRLIALTPATHDQEHIPTLVWSCPQIPDRVGPILGRPGAESPLPMAAAGAQKLAAGGAEAIVMPCNTIHYWLDELQAAVNIPFLSIVDATLAALDVTAKGCRKVGLIATEGTLRADLYQAPLLARGVAPLLPSDADMDDAVLPAIAAVKRSELSAAKAGFTRAVERLNDRGADAVILACTEIPVALGTTAPDGTPPWVDTIEALAAAAVSWSVPDCAEAVPTYPLLRPAAPAGTSPSSSPTTEMMKSVDAAGTVPGCPLPRPVCGST